MLYTEKLRNSAQFSNVYKNGRSKANKYLILYILENNTSVNRLGISVSKKVGNSVIRHRVKRLIKESYRRNEGMFNSGLDIAVIARGGASSISYREMESALLHLCGLHSIKKQS